MAESNLLQILLEIRNIHRSATEDIQNNIWSNSDRYRKRYNSLIRRIIKLNNKNFGDLIAIPEVLNREKGTRNNPSIRDKEKLREVNVQSESLIRRMEEHLDKEYPSGQEDRKDDVNQTTRNTHWPKFIFGCVLAAVAIGFVAWSFTLAHLTEAQYFLLIWILPLASGIAAGSFTGSLNVTHRWQTLVVTATGGFGVWLLTFFLLTPPNDIPSLSITRFEIIDETPIERNNVNSLLTKLIRRPSSNYNIQNFKQLKIACIFVVEDFKIKNNRIDINIKSSLLSYDGSVLANNHIWKFTYTGEWKTRPMVEKIGTEQTTSFVGLPEKAVRSHRAFPVVVLLEGFNPKEVLRGKGTLQVTVQDGLSGTTKSHEQPIKIQFTESHK